MKRTLLLAAMLFAVALAATLGLLLHRAPPTIASTPILQLPTIPEPERSVVQLSYVELAASPHRTEQPGATQVYGWITRADDGRPVSGGTIRLRFQNYATAPGSAAEEHADALVRPQNPAASFRDYRVQEDGGWYVDLPGKGWILDADYTPLKTTGAASRDQPVGHEGRRQLGESVVTSHFSMKPSPRPSLIHTTVSIDVPLERGALELSFAANPGLEVRGLVLDAQASEPIADAQVILTSVRGNPIRETTDEYGQFEILGIDPSELVPEDGWITFQVMAPDLRHERRRIAWEPGQSSIPAFKIVLEQQPR